MSRRRDIILVSIVAPNAALMAENAGIISRAEASAFAIPKSVLIGTTSSAGLIRNSLSSRGARADIPGSGPRRREILTHPTERLLVDGSQFPAAAFGSIVRL
ncbi:hypothetical protein [Bradyrhizobium betae]|uniref:Uncharacterized protein n=1 Tax=Bradyrhizobium betae TaxID=244734 RepID=A0A5P6P9T7_9BRAD|nr:hypothetical protein [Bradyrhizobium betae]MCS3727276.1 hypothetical protein [Bradyrhizobium betae]QFI74818.1 hypothetical protein F8237_21850 [Bradyrhizobium betae]